MGELCNDNQSGQVVSENVNSISHDHTSCKYEWGHAVPVTFKFQHPDSKLHIRAAPIFGTYFPRLSDVGLKSNKYSQQGNRHPIVSLFIIIVGINHANDFSIYKMKDKYAGEKSDQTKMN